MVFMVKHVCIYVCMYINPCRFLDMQNNKMLTFKDNFISETLTPGNHVCPNNQFCFEMHLLIICH